MSRRIEYRVDLDERGQFAATLYDGHTVLAEVDTEDLQYLIETGYVMHGRDHDGLWGYFRLAGVLDASDTLDICG